MGRKSVFSILALAGISRATILLSTQDGVGVV